MTLNNDLASLKKTARIAGILILSLILFAPFSMIYLPSTLVVAGDAAGTAQNMIASGSLLQLGIASDSIVFLIEIVVVVLLYVLLKPVNKTLALIATFARLAMTIVQGINILNLIFPMLLFSEAGYLSVFGTDQLGALALVFFQAHAYGAMIWGLFFSLHLFLLGYLVYKSGYIPGFVGILLVIAALCYLIQGFGNILLPQYSGVFEMIGFLSMVELALPLWLVIKGVHDKA